MALEMKTHKDIGAFEAKPMFGLTWRRLGALAIMLFGGGALFFGVATTVLITSGTSWDVAVAAALQGADDPVVETLTSAATAGMYAMFPFLFPVALWAWWRPVGLPPEHYAQYLFRHNLSTKVTHYEDTYSHHTARRDDAGGSASAAGSVRSAQQPARRAPSESKLRRSLSEHAKRAPRRSRRRSGTKRTERARRRSGGRG